MKVVLDSMLWVSYVTHGQGSRHRLAGKAVLRRAKLVMLPEIVRPFVAGDPDDDAVVQTALTAKADYLVTADKVLLALGKVQDVEIISVRTFAERLPAPR